MTRNANRNDIKPMLWFVTVPVVILPCRMFAIVALQGIWSRQFAGSDSVAYNAMCFYDFWMTMAIFGSILSVFFFAVFSNSITMISFAVGLATLFCFLVFINRFIKNSMAFFCLLIFSNLLSRTYFTFKPIAIFLATILIKFRGRLDFFALSTFFGYDFIRHNRFFCKRLCLEPVVGTYQRSACFIVSNKNHQSIKNKYI